MTRIYQGTAGTKNASRFLKFVTLEDKNWTQVMHEKEIMGKKGGQAEGADKTRPNCTAV